MYRFRKIILFIVIAFTIENVAPIQLVSATEQKDNISVVKSVETEGMIEKETTTEQIPETTIEKETTTEHIPETETEKETATKAKENNFVQSTLSPVNAITIVIDPGHCKIHAGAYYNGYHEEKMVWDIANTCKKVLDKYGDINISLTRDANSCCANIAPGDCLSARSYYSKTLSADFLISMHINANQSTGANVLAPYNSGYRNSLRKKTWAFGYKVLSELSKLGIRNRGLLLRKCTTKVKYKNKKKADYYSIIWHGVCLNIPSVIIEHGYIDHPSDLYGFFSTKKKRETVGKADAKAIISYFNLNKKTISGKFKKKGKSTYYINKKNKKVTGWVKSEGKWYYFDPETAKMKKGFVTIGKNTFYLKRSTGEMVVGWFKVKGATYLSKGDGTLVKNRKYSDGYYTYKFNKNGKRVKRYKRKRKNKKRISHQLH